ncbi:MAG TPA: DUF2442 domain-containing protein [Steroidobacteraceae bacterium]|nr:DUF2442 domain-containing protein [Steroidobacteraceae bacterium]HQZ80504.1 DUF2442 domain-containing protein [Steroidobacteraceae bacterium]
MSPAILRSGGYRFHFWRTMQVSMSARSGQFGIWSRSKLMNSAAHGEPISVAEITNISPHGIWLLLGDEELLMDFEHFPWFRSATIAQLTRVERPSPDHLYWPELDIDVAVESIRQPDAFPLVSRSGLR